MKFSNSNPVQFSQTTLANGLTIIGEQRETAVSAALGFFVRTGARDETAELSGVSHFLEHMMFKGTEKRSALDITYELGALGAQANAYTSEENTVYYMAVLPEYFERALELLSDMLRPSLVREEFDVEKKVILEEIALYQDRPTYLLFESAMREYFNTHPAGSPVLGTIESITALSRDQMKQYFDSRYTAPNIVLAAAGNFVWEDLISLAERYCGGWPSVPTERKYPPHIPTQTERVLTKADLQRAYICFVGGGPAAGDEDRYAAELLTCILGDSTGSRLFWELIDKGLADSASIDAEDMDRVGLMYGYASTSPEQIDEVGSILRSVMSSPDQFTEEDLQRAKTKLRTRVVLQGESSMRRLMAIGNDWIYRNEYSTLQSELERLDAVTKDDILAMLSRHSLTPTTEIKLIPA